MRIIVDYDSSVASAPAGFKACVNAVCQYYDTLFTNNVTITLDVGYGEVNGRTLSTSDLGSSHFTEYFDDYGSTVAALQNEGAPGSAGLSSFPTSSSTLAVLTAQAKALGVYAGIGTGPDGYAGFSSTANFTYDPTQAGTIKAGSYDFVGVVEHEFSEDLGRVSLLNASNPARYSIMDLYRYSAPGVQQTGTGNASYFSLDNGADYYAYWNNFTTGKSTEDLGDWANNGNDAYNAASHSGVHNIVTADDLTLMAAIGWTLAPNASSLTVANSVPQLSAAGTLAALAGASAAYVAVADSAANISANLDALQSAAASGQLSAITVTDIGTISATSAQYGTDATVLGLLSGDFYWTIDATVPGDYSITGGSGRATVFKLSGSASQYTLTPNGDGVGFTLASGSNVDHLSNITALSFGGTLDFVATTPGPANAITSGNITELYGAVFGRLPDVSGLAFYQTYLTANPSVPLTTYATYFLSSGEYAGSHNYAQNTAGENQFVSDSYQNLLHRTASASEVGYYYDNVIAKAVAGLTPGTAAYAAADLAAHALVLTYFSQSPEFLGDVQITAAHPADATHWLYLI